MNIYIDNMWDWNILKGCFTSKLSGESNISPTDIDGIVERKGHFLVLEGKSINGNLTRGQERTLNELIKLKKFTTIVFWGYPKENKIEKMKVFFESNHMYELSTWKEKETKKATHNDLRKVVNFWYNYVDII